MSSPRTTRQGGDAYGDSQGHPYIAGAGAAGVGIQCGSFTQSGASPCAVTFAGSSVLGGTAGLSDMADGSYVVVLDQATIDGADGVASTAGRTATGFSVAGGADGDVIRYAVIGRIAGQKIA